ncbi:MAG: tetratricopeptide repeat protein [Ignavibacteria bacterium]|nr:tetratricopeptide repeat protein [Ignavibacteria bacterium]
MQGYNSYLSEEIETLLESATNLRRWGNYKKADKLFTYLDIKYPNNPLVKNIWAEIKLLLKDNNSALILLRESVNIYSHNNDSEGKDNCEYLIGLLRKLKKDPKDLDEFLRWLSKNKNKVSLPNSNCDIVFNEEEQIQHFRQQQKYLPIVDSIDQLIKVSEKHLSGKSLPDDFVNLYESLKTYPKSKKDIADILLDVDLKEILKRQIYGIAVILHNYDEIYLAKIFYITATIIDNKYFLAYEYLADCYADNSQYEYALLNYEKALSLINVYKNNNPHANELNPSTAIYYGLAKCYEMLIDYDNARKYYSYALTQEDGNFFGFIYFDSISINESLKQLEIIQENFISKQNNGNDFVELTNDVSLIGENYYYHNVRNEKELEVAVIKRITFYKKLSNKGRAFLITAEYLIDNFPKFLDCAPIMIEYCKLLEQELYEKIYKKLEAWSKAKNIDIQTGPNSNNINKFERIFLGSYVHLTNDISFIQFINENFSEKDRVFLLQNLKVCVNEIIEYRNSSAHKNQTTYEKVVYVRNKLITEGVLEKLGNVT